MTGRRGAHPALWILLIVIAAVGAVTTWQRASRETMVLATTTCPFRGDPIVTLSADVVPVDSAPVLAHEEVHAAQCRELGPWRYRWENLFDSGKLALEAPAYCAGATVRLRAGHDTTRVRQRLIESTVEALSHVADSVTVVEALRSRCRELLGSGRSGATQAASIYVIDLGSAAMLGTLHGDRDQRSRRRSTHEELIHGGDARPESRPYRYEHQDKRNSMIEE